MANVYTNYNAVLSTSALTTLYTVPSETTAIIKSIRLTNNTANTPTISMDVLDSSQSNTEFTILNTQSLAANTSVEILTVPLVLEKSDALKATISSTDSIHIGISFLSIT